MFRSSLLFVIICFVLIVCDVHAIDTFGNVPGAPINPTGMPGMPDSPGAPSAPGIPPRQRDGRTAVASEAVLAAEQEIDTQFKSFIATINQGNEPDKAALSQLAATLKKNGQYVQRMNTKTQANLHMLNAWMYYFAGQLKRARLDANAAYKADPLNKDAQTTFIVMSIANNEVKNVKNTITAARKKAAKPAAVANRQNVPILPPTPGEMSESALLDFDANSIKVELLGKKIGNFDAACLNGDSFSFKGGKTLLMLLWKNADLGTDTSSGNPAPQPMMIPGVTGSMPGVGAAQSGQTLTPLQAYGMLFARGFQNSKIAFLGLNLDVEDQSGAVMETLLKNAWPWPQAMEQDPRNAAALASLVSAHAGKPVLVVVGPDGEIKYAGTLSGFILRMIANYAQTASETSLAMPESAKKSEDANALSMPATTIEPKEANAPVTTTTTSPAPVATPEPRAPKSDEEKLNPAATDLYQFAVSQKRMAYATGYGTIVNACRQILREYPDAPEAEKARQLLREIPPNKRAQFKITNEEMGL